MSAAPHYAYVQGDHVCAIYRTPEEQLHAAIEYIKEGLARGERCLYVVGEHDQPTFRDALAGAGIDVAREEARGSLVLLTKHEGHLSGGSFDPARMIAMLEKAVQDALDAGFNGLCAAGDMNWLLDGAPGTERLAEYEAKLNYFYESHRALGLCLYRRSMPGIVLDRCLATHRVVRLAGGLLANPFYELPELAATRPGSADGIEERLDKLSAA
jgi:MEDS: MEthanogen/methylotroph, DcmR Sensory domain